MALPFVLVSIVNIVGFIIDLFFAVDAIFPALVIL